MYSSKIHILFSLLKYKVSLAVTFTTITGYLINTGEFDISLLTLFLGVFFIAGGASAYNQIIERKQDGLMERTKYRPIPSGKISLRSSLFISTTVSIIGVVILYLKFGFMPAFLGGFNLLWYTLVYTALKKVTPFAVIPGALTGAIPAFIGWTAAGGYLFDQRIMLIGLFLFIWQIPHFWLLLMKYADQYETAGFPSIHNTLSRESFKIITLAWVVATSIVSVMFPVFNVIHSIPLNISIILLNIVFVVFFVKLTFSELTEISFKKAVISMNTYMIMFMLVLIAYFLF